MPRPSQKVRFVVRLPKGHPDIALFEQIHQGDAPLVDRGAEFLLVYDYHIQLLHRSSRFFEQLLRLFARNKVEYQPESFEQMRQALRTATVQLERLEAACKKS